MDAAELNLEARPDHRAKLKVLSSNRSRLDDARPIVTKSPFDLNTIRQFSRWVDFLLAAFVSWSCLTLIGVSFLDASVRTALPFAAMPILAVWGAWSANAYRFAYTERAVHHMGRVLIGSGLALLAGFTLCWLFGLGGTTPALGLMTLFVWVTLIALHLHYVAVIKGLIRSNRLSENVVIVGATEHARGMIENNAKNRELNVVGIFDDRLGRAPESIGGIPVLGNLTDLMEWDELPKIDRIIVTVSSKAHNRVRFLIDQLRLLPNRVVLLLDLEEFNPEQTSLAQVADAPAAYVSGAPRDNRRANVKRVSDVVIASLMLLGFSPIMLISALLIKLDSDGPVFFRQKRHGFNNRIIRVWKFRSMRPDKKAEDGEITQVTADDDRVTKIGKILRRTSLDELPQLFNVLKGEMSLVGPRPHAVGMTTEETAVHDLVSHYAHRHRVKPGLTGWAQINGSRGPVHTASEVHERVRLDMEYVNRSSFWFDLYIMAMTAPCLLGDADKDR